jgi:dipeptidase D
MDADDAKETVALLASLHHGVLAMSPDVAGLVQTSTNLATVSTKGEVVEIVTSQRSAIESNVLAAARMVVTVCELARFEVEHGGKYPGWKPEPNSEIVRKLQEVHKKLFGEPAKLIAMHAGLECSVIGEKYPGMQMVSFGPTIVDPHSPNERVQISREPVSELGHSPGAGRAHTSTNLRTTSGWQMIGSQMKSESDKVRFPAGGLMCSAGKNER